MKLDAELSYEHAVRLREICGTLGLGSPYMRTGVFAAVFWGLWFWAKPPISFTEIDDEYFARPFALFVNLGFQDDTEAVPKTWLPHWLMPLLGACIGLMI